MANLEMREAGNLDKSRQLWVLPGPALRRRFDLLWAPRRIESPAVNPNIVSMVRYPGLCWGATSPNARAPIVAHTMYERGKRTQPNVTNTRRVLALK
eukprot:94419-Rhodomonas_salina.3